MDGIPENNLTSKSKTAVFPQGNWQKRNNMIEKGVDFKN
jgi:hypothetical protein